MGEVGGIECDQRTKRFEFAGNGLSVDADNERERALRLIDLPLCGLSPHGAAENDGNQEAPNTA
jgi:hypothetical protein